MSNLKQTENFGFQRDSSGRIVALLVVLFVLSLMGGFWLVSRGRPVDTEVLTPQPPAKQEQDQQTVKSDSKQEEHSDPPIGPTPTSEIVGKWWGVFEGAPAVLDIEVVDERHFKGTLTETTNLGDWVVQFEGEVQGDSGNRSIVIEEKEVSGAPSSKTTTEWILCKDEGNLRDGWLEGTGESLDSSQRNAADAYEWRFSRVPHGTAVPSLTQATVNAAATEVRQLQQIMARIALRYDERATAFQSRDLDGYFNYTSPDWTWVSETQETETLESSRQYYKKVFEAGESKSIETTIQEASRSDVDTVVLKVRITTSKRDGSQREIIQEDTWVRQGDQWLCRKEQRLSSEAVNSHLFHGE